jgi:hypothetical protein
MFLAAAENESLGPLAGDTVHTVYGLDGGCTASFDSMRGAGTGRASRFGRQIFGSRGIILFPMQKSMKPTPVCASIPQTG